MLTVVAVQAKQLPVAAVRRIIVVVAVFVMHRQFVKFFTGKLSATPGAYPWQDLERLIAVKITPMSPQLTRLSENMLQLIAGRWGRFY